MKTLTAWVVLVLGIILLLPMLGITQIGTATSGILGWLLAIIIILLGLYHIIANYNK